MVGLVKKTKPAKKPLTTTKCSILKDRQKKERNKNDFFLGCPKDTKNEEYWNELFLSPYRHCVCLINFLTPFPSRYSQPKQRFGLLGSRQGRSKKTMYLHCN